jgi:CHAD domain-containing protein
MAARNRHKSTLARGVVQSPAARTLAASAALAAGTVATAKIASTRGAPERRYRLDVEETPKQGVSRVARGELDLTMRLLTAAPNGDAGAESVHEARKALKRLRALLRLSRPALDERRYQRENLIFRDAGRELSDARDAQVLLETLGGLLDRYGAELPRGTWARLHGALEAGAAHPAQASGSDGYDDVLAILARARRRVSSWSLPTENGRDSLNEGFARIYKRGRRRLRRAKADPTPENLHELRKRAKDLWHAAQLLEPVCPEKMKPLAKSAHQLSNLLGDDHDLSVLLQYADAHPELLDEGERERLEKLVNRRRKSLRREALKYAGELYKRKPKRMVRRLALT